MPALFPAPLGHPALVSGRVFPLHARAACCTGLWPTVHTPYRCCFLPWSLAVCLHSISVLLPALISGRLYTHSLPVLPPLVSGQLPTHSVPGTRRHKEQIPIPDPAIQPPRPLETRDPVSVRDYSPSIGDVLQRHAFCPQIGRTTTSVPCSAPRP